MYLHDDKEIFKEIIEQVAAETGRTEIIIEKDYYVTIQPCAERFYTDCASLLATRCIEDSAYGV